MHRNRVNTKWLCIFVLIVPFVLVMAGCSDCTNSTVSRPIPTVVFATPACGVTNVPVDIKAITVTFSTSMAGATINDTSFTVAGPRTTPIAGVVSYSAASNTAQFAPTDPLPPNTLITVTITTGAESALGMAMAANSVCSFTTAAAAAGTPPTVASLSPSCSATGVPINDKIAVTFSEAMDPNTITGANLMVTGPGTTPIAGAITYVVASNIATFTPNVNLPAGTLITVTATTGVKDLADTAMVNNFSCGFTTAIAPSSIAPTVISTSPSCHAIGVALNTQVAATFSEAMDPATITGSTFTVTGPGTTAVPGNVAYAGTGSAATFTPTSNLVSSTVYTLTVTTGAKDLADNALTSNFTCTFTTGSAPAITPPTVILTSPVCGATGVALNKTVNATFSEAMDPLTITTANVLLAGPGTTAVTGTVAYDAINDIATFTPLSNLQSGTLYTFTITTGVKDVAENPMAANFDSPPCTFTTAATLGPPPVDLGTASLFGAFGGGAGITNQGISTVVNGNIGTTGVSTKITGFHDNGPGCTYIETPLNVGAVNGSIDTAPPPPTVACPTEGTAVTFAIASQAAADALTAYNALVALPGGLDVSTCPGCGGGGAGELGGRTLAPGIYKSAPGSYGITIGDLTLDAQGDTNATWAFQMATTLTVGTPQAPRNIILAHGAQAKNVFWQVGSAATINGILGGGTMMGTIIAQTGVSVSTAGVNAITTINGRALVLTGPVTMVNTVINVPAP